MVKKISLLFVVVILAFLSGIVFNTVFFNAKEDSVVVAYADEPLVMVAEPSEFYMIDGASVRLVVGESGIRFKTEMTEAFYDSVVAKGGKWYTLIAPNVTVSQLNANNSDAVCFGVNEEIIPSKDCVGGVITYSYTTCILYDNDKLTETQLQEAYAMPLTARSFVKYVENGREHFIYTSENSDTVRSISEVASKILLKDALNAGIYQLEENSTRRDILLKYILDENKIFTKEGVAYLTGNGAQFSFLGVPDGNYTARINGSSQNISVVDGKASCSFSSLTLGSEYDLILTSASEVTHLGRVKCTDRTISSEEEFWAMIESYTGSSTQTQKYYTLTSDITLSERDWKGGTYTFLDIFDGNGYTITVEKTPKFGVFGKTLGKNSAIKNLKLVVNDVHYEKNASASTFTNCILASACSSGSKVENVFINIAPKSQVESLNLSCFGGLIGRPVNSASVNNVYINIADNVYGEFPNDVYASCGILSATLGNESANRIDCFSNVFIVSKNIKHLALFRANAGVLDESPVYCHCSKTDKSLLALNNWDKIVHVDKEIYRYDTVSELEQNVGEKFSQSCIGWSLEGESKIERTQVELKVDNADLTVGNSAIVELKYGEYVINAKCQLVVDNASVIMVENGKLVAVGSGVTTIKVATTLNGEVKIFTTEITVG